MISNGCLEWWAKAYYTERMQEPTIINVLVERDGDWWVAHCLQINLATQARTLGELHVEIERIITDHLETCQELGTDPFEMAAPQRF